MNKIDLNTCIYDPLLSGPLKPLRRAMLNALPENKDIKILDLCSGTGDQLLTLELNGYRNLHGLDLDPGMVAYARRNSRIIQYYEGDASATNFPNRSFDIVTISLALHDKDQALREAILLEADRLLKPDGYILTADFAFDKNSTFMGRLMISTVEFLARGDHYKNFRDYTRRGGMLKILPMNIFEVKEVGRAVNSSIAVWKLSKL